MTDTIICPDCHRDANAILLVWALDGNEIVCLDCTQKRHGLPPMAELRAAATTKKPSKRKKTTPDLFSQG